MMSRDVFSIMPEPIGFKSFLANEATRPKWEEENGADPIVQ